MKIVLKIFIVLFLIVSSLLIYATYVGTSGLVTKEYVINDDTLSNDFDGLKVVHFSDLHYNRAIDKKKVNNIVKEINLINADIVVFTGDLIDKDMVISDNDYSFLTNALKNIKSKYGKFAVLGNHDFIKKDKVIKVFNESDFKYLENDYEVIISKNNEKIYMMGLGNVTNNLDNINELADKVKETDGYKIVLLHEPDISDDVMKYINVNLILGGHSHNGQFRLPFIGAVYTPNGAKKYYDEYYEVNGTDIYISSGIGVSRINMRLFNRPSINFYRINK